MAAAVSFGLTNFGPEPPIKSDAQQIAEIGKEPSGDGPTSGWGSLGKRLSEKLNGSDSRYRIIEGRNPDDTDFVSGKQSSSYGVYTNQISLLGQLFK